jgi:PIN domain nuclease of toxin-antitoxin system
MHSHHEPIAQHKGTGFAARWPSVLDPFDRLLIVQAQTERLNLIHTDLKLTPHQVDLQLI